MKKIASIVLALVLVLVMAAPAMAEEAATNPVEHIITITNAVSGHTYEAYQIFAGDFAEKDGEDVLSNVVWGASVADANMLAALKADKTVVDTKTVTGEDNTETTADVTVGDLFANAETAADVAEILADNKNNSKLVERFAEIAAENLTDTCAGTSSEVNGVYTITVNGDGYYLIMDKESTVLSTDAYTKYILQVLDNVEVTAKSDAPEVDKDIIEDSKDVEAADYNIGDSILFRITGTVSSQYDGYHTYKYVFHDTVSNGLTPTLTYDESDSTNVKSGVVVEVGETDITEEFTITYSDQKLTISCDDLKKIEGIKADSQIVVEYYAVLNGNAVIGNTGNPNEVYLEYSNNPNWNGEGDTVPTGNTPEDEVLVFTYELDVTKVDADNTETKLQGAEFILYREVADETATDETKTVIEYVKVDATYKVSGWTGVETEASVLKSDANGLFNVIGLDVGTYYLKETKAPVGYNLLTDPIQIVITAEINAEEEAEDERLTALKITVGDLTTDGDLNTGVVTMKVLNKAGTVLPETGGIGTTVFYIGGGLLIVAAIVLLISKRKADAK